MKMIKEFYQLSSRGLFKPTNPYDEKTLTNFIAKWNKYGKIENLIKRQSTIYIYINKVSWNGLCYV
jgi:hypothetical protein